MKKTILFFTLMVLFSLSVFAIPQYNLFTGFITLSGANVAVGTTLSATIGGVDAGSYTIDTAGWYAIAVTSPSGATTDTIVFSIDSSGYSSINTLTATYSNGQENGVPVKLNFAFTGTTTTTPTTPSTGTSPGTSFVTPPIVSVIGTKMDIAQVSDIVSSLPEGWTNVEVYSIDIISETVTIDLQIGIEKALTEATSPQAQEALQAVKDKLGAKQIKQIIVTKILEVYRVDNKDTGESVYRTKIKLSFTAPNDMRNVEIIEVVPKDVAESSDELIFTGIVPKILQKDPILQWIFNEINKGVTKEMSYIVKKKLGSIDSTTIAVGVEKPAEVVQPPLPPKEEKVPFMSRTVAGILIIVLIVLIGLIVYYVYTHKKEKEKKKR